MKSDEQKIIEKWGDRRLIEETVKSMNLHTTPAPETIARLSTLEEKSRTIMDYLKENKEEHKELFNIVEDINKKLDDALAKKADKSEVEELNKTVEDLKTWKIKILAVGSVILFVVTFLKDSILSFIRNL